MPVSIDEGNEVTIGCVRAGGWGAALILRNTFAVPLPPEEAWRLLLDIRRISQCVPGGELTEIVDEDSFKGRMRVRLGPILVEFAGTARFESRDEVAHAASLRAAGNDTKGRGSATARAQFGLAPDPAGALVSIETDLHLAGMIAQYGRAGGVIAALAQQLVEEFAGNLAADIAREHRSEATATPTAAAPRPQPRTLSGLGLLCRAVLARLKRLLTRRAL